MIKHLLHNGLRFRGRWLLTPQGHHYRLITEPGSGHIFACFCGWRWLPELHYGQLTRYDTFWPYRA